MRAFDLIKSKLIEALVMASLYWNSPFEVMCDSSDYVIGAVLGKGKTCSLELSFVSCRECMD